MSASPENPQPAEKARQHPFRRAILRGLALILPPLLTIVVFFWAWHIIEDYVLVPLEGIARNVIVWQIDETRDQIPEEANVGQGKFTYQGREYVALKNDRQWIPSHVYDTVQTSPGERLPETAEGYYRRFVDIRYLGRKTVIPIFLCGFVLVLYFLGKFLAAGVGRILWNSGESVVHRLPVIRNVYSSVKQITDFVLSEREIEYTRIVAVEYPRHGMWSVGFVTGDGMSEVRNKAGEPIISVLMPTSPMPATGFTIQVRKSETIDLDITMDQAIQFVVSCGVVVPPHQQSTVVSDKIAASISPAEHEAARDSRQSAAMVGSGDGSNDESPPEDSPS